MRSSRRLLALVGLLFAPLSGCVTWPASLAPASPSRPWAPHSRARAALATRAAREFTVPADPALPWPTRRAALDTTHVYTLAELIDFAESANPDTRIAWEQARQAALAVGISWAEYLPVLSAGVLGGYQHTNFPLPLAINAKGSFAVDNFELVPSLALKWLLFDFGGRVSLVQSARQLSVAANATFTGVHQKLILDVAKAFYKLNAARGQAAVAREALTHAERMAEAVQERRARGLATVVESTHAKREVVQAQYDAAQADAVEVDSYAELLEAMGADPSLQIRVEDNASHPLPRGIDQRVDRYVQSALRTRPDLVAAVARIRAADAKVVAAKSAFFPKVGVAGALSEEVLGTSIEGSRFFEQTLPTASALVQLDWTLFDGGIHYAQLKIAESQRAEAEDALLRLQDHAVRQVIAAYNAVRTGLKRYQAAEALAGAADVAEDAAEGAYDHGVGTYTEAMNAQTARAQAHSAKEQAYAEVLTAAATLAFASGGLTSARALHP